MGKKVKNSFPPENSRWIRGELIGKGSFGAVSLGFDPVNGRVFAVKSVAVNSASSAKLDAIENEINLLRSLSSPFIVEYYADDSTMSAPELFHRNLHMEYLSGGTAAESSGADEELLRRYTWCLTSALRYIHSRGIIHCDVKGRNVLLGPTPGTAKLADFGSAKREGEDDGVVPRGSPLWMAPEVVRGEAQGYESDVWALGCTLIEMVTGLPAWQDEGAEKTLRLIGYSDELPRCPTQLSELGRDFLDKCLRREPGERWSCDQLLTHPFLKVESAVRDEESWSPQSVIEWPRLIWSDEEEKGGAWGSDVGRCVVSSAGKRMCELAGVGGANWESDGWVVVRGEAGTSSEYAEMLRAKVEFRCPVPLVNVGSLGVSQGGDWAEKEEIERLSVTSVKGHASVKSGELLYVILSFLYYTNCLLYIVSSFFIGVNKSNNATGYTENQSYTSYGECRRMDFQLRRNCSKEE